MSFTSAEPRSRWSDVALSAASRAISCCGDYIAATALALTLQAGGDRGIGVAALLIAAALPLALFGAPAGWLADRIDSRVLVVTTALAQAAVCLVLAFVHAPATMIALVAILALGSALTQPALGALTPEMVTRDDLPKATSVMQTATTIGMLSGPVLGGVLVSVFGGPRVPLLLDAVSFLVLAAAGMMIHARRGRRAVVTVVPEVVDAPQWTIRRDRLMRTLLIALGAVVASVTAMTIAEVFFVRSTLHASPATYGLIAAMWECGILIGVLPFSRLKGDDAQLVRAVLVILTLVSIVVLGSSAVPAAWWLAPIYLVGGALNAGLNVIVGVLVARRVPRAIRGRVGGTFSAVAAGANLAGYVAGGALLPLMSPRSLIACSAVVSLVVALAFLIPSGRTTTSRAAAPALVD
jgi:MFS family permease